MGFKELGNGDPTYWTPADRKFCNERIEKLVLECKEGSHYKYYHLSQPEPNADNFTVKYGRIGSSQTTHRYNYVKDRKTMYDQFIAKIGKNKSPYQLQSYKFFNEHSSAYEEFMQKMGSDAELFD
jgi:predicted DNA-binding WGR domain protein